MKTVYITMTVFTLMLLITGYFIDSSLPLKGIKSGSGYFIKILPIFVLAFFVAGMIQVLVPNEFVIKWMGDETGFRGIFIGSVAGAVTPGGPFVSFPIAASIYKSGAGIGPMVAYITAWCLLSVTRIPYEMAFVGVKFTVIRVASCLLFPWIAGIIAQAIYPRY